MSSASRRLPRIRTRSRSGAEFTRKVSHITLIAQQRDWLPEGTQDYSSIYEGNAFAMGFGRKLRAGPLGDKRKTQRSQTYVSATVETPASRHSLAIIDISPLGARVLGRVPATSRRELRIRVNGVDLFGSVAWRKDNNFGFKFEEILSEHHSSEICAAVLAAEEHNQGFDRDAILQELSNRPVASVTTASNDAAGGEETARHPV